MYITVVLISALLIKLQLGHVYADTAYLDIILTRNNQQFTVFENAKPIVLRINPQLELKQENGQCNGYCSINGIQNVTNNCNIVNTHLNVLIDRSATMTFNGDWSCYFWADGIHPRETFYLNPRFNMNIMQIDLSMLPALPPNSSQPSIEPTAALLHNTTVFNITSPVYELKLAEGKQILAMEISKIHQYQKYAISACTGECEVNGKEKIPTTKCKTKYAEQEQKVINVELKEINVEKKYTGNWTCTFHLQTKENLTSIDYTQILSITVPEIQTKDDKMWIYIGSGVSALVLLVIIGQTVCILYFKSKAKKAEMVKNLTPTKSGSDDNLADSRYIRHDHGSNEGVRESGIYELLDTVRERAPIPPPIETLPATLPPLARSMSSQHLAVGPQPGVSRTNPRPPRIVQQNEPKFNTIGAQMSLERIKNRPPLPLPTEEEIYEVVTPEASPKPPNKFLPKIGQGSPLLSQNIRIPNSPALGRKQPLLPPGGLSPPGSSRSPMMPPGHSLPGHIVQPPFGPSTCPLINGKPVNAMAMGAMPKLPSMITNANLRPVKPIVKAPVGETPGMTPRKDFRMPPLDEPRTTPDGPRMPLGGFRMPAADGPKIQPGGFRMPAADGPRMQPGGFRMPHADGPRVQPGGFRMPQADGPRVTPANNSRMPPAPSSTNIASKLGHVPSFKSKPPIPMPKRYDIEPSEDPLSYHGSSDEEFDCYDVLPEYRIYGNAPPKKLL